MPVRPIKQFGQHFLKDDSLAERIVEAAGIQPGEAVWEIGPGLGVLTRHLLNRTNKLTAFEIDNRLASLLSNHYGNKLNLVNRDVLAINWHELLSRDIADTGQLVRLVSNLPYQITSPVLYALEENAASFSCAVLMIQKEVAQRLAARPGSKAYGVLTLKLAYAFSTELLFNVPPEAFDPPPQVHSSVVRLLPRQDKPNPKSLDIYRKIIERSFAQRRKTLRNNLRGMFSPDKLAELERNSGIDFSRRGETIEEGEYVRLADCAFEPGSS